MTEDFGIRVTTPYGVFEYPEANEIRSKNGYIVITSDDYGADQQRYAKIAGPCVAEWIVKKVD